MKNMKFILAITFLVCLSLAYTTLAAPRSVKVKARSDLPLLELHLLNSLVSQALIQDENEGMTKTYCKLVLSLLKNFGSAFAPSDNYCKDLTDDETTFPENSHNKEHTYNLVLDVLKKISPVAKKK